MAALRSAGLRALAALPRTPDLVILDGNHDWLTAPEEVGLLSFAAEHPTTPPVTTMIKADLKCSSVASASVLAKVERDEWPEAKLLALLDVPGLPRFYDYAPEAKPPYIAMAHAPGRTAARLCSPPRLNPTEVAAVKDKLRGRARRGPQGQQR